MAGSTSFTWKHALKLHSTLSPFESPVPETHKAFKDVKPVSWRRINITGLLVTIYGIDELPKQSGDIVCLWLLHGRGDTQDSMARCAAAFIHAWSNRREPGTALDVRHLITHIPSYLPFRISQHICGGVSLGGHATWQLLLNEPCIAAGIVVIGCPDYVRLMADRAIRSQVPSTMDSEPPGRNFLGSKDFPPPLIAAIEKYDPAGILLGELDTVTGDDHLHPPSEPEKKRLRRIMTQRLAGKKIICLSGAKDKLVPHAQAEPFLTWLQRAIDKKDGWFNDQGIELEDIVDPDGRHEFSSRMRKEAERWLCDYLAAASESGRSSKL